MDWMDIPISFGRQLHWASPGYRPAPHAPVSRLRQAVPTTSRRPRTKPFSSRRENGRKNTRAIVTLHDQQWSSIMLGRLFSLIYRLSCRTTLIEIGAHRLAR
jgi:hypothetical protein